MHGVMNSIFTGPLQHAGRLINVIRFSQLCKVVTMVLIEHRKPESSEVSSLFEVTHRISAGAGI
jgi:hypothetical protein